MDVESIGHAAGIFQEHPRTIERGLAAVNGKPVICINDVPHYDPRDIMAAVKWVRETKARTGQQEIEEPTLSTPPRQRGNQQRHHLNGETKMTTKEKEQAIANFETAIDREMGDGKRSRREAVAVIATKNPQLHAEFLKASRQRLSQFRRQLTF